MVGTDFQRGVADPSHARFFAGRKSRRPHIHQLEASAGLAIRGTLKGFTVRSTTC